jgi:site-specific DNA recombinase
MTAMAAAVPAVRRVATYERVSSEDQRERETIKTQTDEIARHLASQPGLDLVERYVDDGVSGTIPLAERPDGRRLLTDATAGLFEEIWVYKVDRLGRDAVDLLVVRRRLDALGIALVSVVEGQPDLLGYDVQAVVADHYRREFARRSADGMNRAAREGRYTGGIVPFGYRVEGHKASARLVPDEAVVWADRSAADLVRDMYERLALRSQSCRAIAADFNAAGIPTHYTRDGRGVRGKRTCGLWLAGRIRNLVVNPLYRGELRYGSRTAKRDREVIAAPIGALVSPTLWEEAQAALARNRRCAKNTHRVYMLKGVVRCGICGLTYVGSWSNAAGWYRCGGQLVERGPIPGRCPGCAIRTDSIEPAIWADIERFLRDPGDVFDKLDGPAEREAQGAIAEAESITLARALEALESQRKQATALSIRGRLADGELDDELDRIDRERTALQARVAALQAPRAEIVPQEVHDLLAEVRARLDAGLTEEQRAEIVRLLVGIVVHTDVTYGKRTAKAVVTYRFPCVVPTRTGIPASQNYTTLRRVIELPVGRQPSPPPFHALVAGTHEEGAGCRDGPPRGSPTDSSSPRGERW